MADRWGNSGETVTDFIFLGSKIATDGNCSHEIERRLLLGRKAITNLDSIFKSRDITLPTKVGLVTLLLTVCNQGLTVVLEKTLESPLDSREITLVSPKGNQP